MKGVVAASHPLTAKAGIEILESGGNAVDAAVAASFASFVAESVLTSIGGSGIATVFDARTNRSAFYDFFSNMPSGKPGDGMDFRKVTIDFGTATQDFYIGRASVAVPGAVAGLCLMAEEMGTMPLPELMAPAIRMAKEGVALTGFMAYTLELLEPIFTYTPELRAIFAPGGRLLREGDIVRIRELAGLLEGIARDGAGVFYTGSAAEALVEDQQANGGLITYQDMRSYEARSAEPIVTEYHGHTVVLPSAPSSGGVLVAFSLKLLDRMDIGRYDFLSPEHLHLLAQVMRVTNEARSELLGNGNGGVQEILDPKNVDEYLGRLPLDDEHGGGPFRDRIPGNTTHISVMDGEGMVVSLTTTAGEAAGYMVKGTGIIPNNMLGEVDLHPGGFHRLPPGARLETMMTPLVLLKDGKPVLAVGSGGSNRIRSAILQVLLNVVDFGLPLDKAVNAPRIHFEHGVMQAEGGIPNSTIEALRKMGYSVNAWDDVNMFFGGANAVGISPDGEPVAAGDRRRGGTTAVAR